MNKPEYTLGKLYHPGEKTPDSDEPIDYYVIWFDTEGHEGTVQICRDDPCEALRMAYVILKALNE